MRKRKYRKKRNVNFVIMAIFSATFLFIGLAYANTNQILNITSIARIGNASKPSLSLSHTNLSMTINQTETIIAYINGITQNVTWVSSNPECATIDGAGNITAIGNGSTIITATCGNLTASCTVLVSNGQDGPIIFEIIDDQTIENHIYYSRWFIRNNSNKKIISWSFDAIFPDGTVYHSSTFEQLGISIVGNKFSGGELEIGQELAIIGSMDAPEGYVLEEYLPVKIQNIHVVFEDGSENNSGQNPDIPDIPDEPKIEVSATGLFIDKYYIELTAGQTTTITATVQPENATGEYVWESDDINIARVDNGVVTAISQGQTKIRVTFGNQIAESTINVLQGAQVNPTISLNKTQLNLNIGNKETLVATKNPENATGDIIWDSSDSSIVSVDQSGNIEAKAIGTAVITASIGSINAHCTVVVSEQFSDSPLLANIIVTGSNNETEIWNGRLTITNNSDRNITNWSVTIALPSGSSCNIWNLPGNTSRTELIFSGGSLSTGSKIDFDGSFKLPTGYNWDDYLGKEIPITNVIVEYE